MTENGKQRTTYVILQRSKTDLVQEQDSNPPRSPAEAAARATVRWTQMGAVEAASGDAAIRAHVREYADEGTFVAVPARSWQPQTVTTETKTTVKIGDAQ